MTGEVQDSADRAEVESIRRLQRLRHLRRAIYEAARRADAHFRLELALERGVRLSTGPASARRPA